jgi:hypothetical protein
VRFDRDRERLVASGEFDLGPGSRVRVLVTAVHFDDRRIDFKITDFNPSTGKHGEKKAAPVPAPSLRGLPPKAGGGVPTGISSKDARHEARRARRGEGRVRREEGRVPARRANPAPPLGELASKASLSASPEKGKPAKKGKSAKHPVAAAVPAAKRAKKTKGPKRSR